VNQALAARRDKWWSPTIRAAVVVPRLGARRAVDIRTLDRHPLASVGGLLLAFRIFQAQPPPDIPHGRRLDPPQAAKHPAQTQPPQGECQSERCRPDTLADCLLCRAWAF
jgi:hypothetical protein